MSEQAGTATQDALRRLVADLPPGARLPAERKLAESLGVARMTIRGALAGLERDGLVITRPGSGSHRLGQVIPLKVGLRPFAAAVTEAGMVPTVRLLTEHAEAPTEAREFLGPDQELITLQRLRLGDDVPLAIERVWLPASQLANFDADTASHSLYRYLEDRGLRPDAGEETVTAALPDASEAELLAISPHRPVLRLIRHGLVDGVPLEYGTAVFPADRYQLTFPVVTGSSGG